MSKLDDPSLPQLELREGVLFLSGDLTLYSVNQFYTEGSKILSHEPSLWLDLSGVEKFDHALPALLLAWRAQAKRLDKPFSLKHLSKDMLMLARLSGVDDILLDCCTH